MVMLMFRHCIDIYIKSSVIVLKSLRLITQFPRENTNLFHEEDPQNAVWFTQTNAYSIRVKNNTVSPFK